MAPYGHKGTDWVGFDDQASLVYKVKSQVKGLSYVQHFVILTQFEKNVGINKYHNTGYYSQ